MNWRRVVRLGWLATVLVSEASQAATGWTMDAVRSRLEFTATQAGGEFDGVFERFQADIQFDPADLGGSHFRVAVQTASAATGEKDRDRTLAGSDFFAADRWPVARFEADRFVALGGGRFEALGKLTIRDRTRDLRLPFRFEPTDGGAQAGLAGDTTIHRLDYGVGQGEWADTSLVGNDVRIRFALLLHRK